MEMTDRELIKKLDQIEEGLTQWERDFIIKTFEKVVDRGRSLSSKQRAVAERIYSEKG